MPTLVQDRFDRLVSFPPTTFPVLSLYLNAPPNEHGHDDVDRFLRLELPARGRTFEPRSASRFEDDMGKKKRGGYNQDHFKVRGSMQPGGDIVQERQEQKLTQQKEEVPRPAKSDEAAIPDE